MKKKYNIQQIVTIGDDTEYIVSDGEYHSTFRVGNLALEAKYLGIDNIEEYLIAQHEDMRKSEPGYAHPGPTNAQLEHPTVRCAWEEFKIIQKLCGGGYEQRT